MNHLERFLFYTSLNSILCLFFLSFFEFPLTLQSQSHFLKPTCYIYSHGFSVDVPSFVSLACSTFFFFNPLFAELILVDLEIFSLSLHLNSIGQAFGPPIGKFDPVVPYSASVWCRPFVYRSWGTLDSLRTIVV